MFFQCWRLILSEVPYLENFLVCNHFNQPKLVWICMILTKNAVSDRCWESKIEGSGFESCRPLFVKLFLSNWGDTQTWFHWLPAHRAPPGMPPACWKNNRLEKSVVLYTPKKILSGLYPKYQLEISTFSAWIFSDLLVNTISFSIQISKSIISKIKANTVE